VTDYSAVGPPLPPIAPRRYRQSARHQAVSDIVMRRGPRPSGMTNSYDARAVRANLAPRIARPH